MNLFRKLFGSNSARPKKHHERTEAISNISSVAKNKIPSNAEIIVESKVPEFCSIGNLVYEKKYHEAIELGKKLLTKTPNSAGVHVNLMEAYFKVRDENPIFYDKHIEHARFAMLYGHNTGYVQKKLAIGLEKQNLINHALQVYDIVLNDKFHFSKHGCGNKEEFIKRKERLIKKIGKSIENEETTLFTNEEVDSIIKQVQIDDERIKQEEIEYERKMQRLRRELGI